jgi:hypothetical protein
MKRYVQDQIVKDLKKKMVFLGGPRQVGKTTVAKSILKNKKAYLNWDADEHRELILKRKIPARPLVVFDEIHKFKSWRNFLKGLYDTRRGDQKFLITGSARLDYYRFGGDSLQGRYHFLRLHPLSVAELNIAKNKELRDLLVLGGFPEPFLGGSEIEAKRWTREYRTRFIRDDLTNLERVDDLGKLEMLMLRLPDLVGSPLSVNALREDLQVSHKTVSKWISILERLYGLFRLSPFGAPKIRAVRKEQKHYHFDWTLVKEKGIRFENLVAVHLLKWIHFEEDSKGRGMELRYFRDVDGREVDFVVLEDGNPIQFIECKWNDRPVSHGLKYLKLRFPRCEAWQIAAQGKEDYLSSENIRVCPAPLFLKNLI